MVVQAGWACRVVCWVPGRDLPVPLVGTVAQRVDAPAYRSCTLPRRPALLAGRPAAALRC